MTCGIPDRGSHAGLPSTAGPRRQARSSPGGDLGQTRDDGIILDAVVVEVVAEAARLRESGALPPGFEADLDRRFLDIAHDPDALAREAARKARGRYGSARFGSVPRPLRPLVTVARRSKRFAGSLARSSRRAVGPHVRSLERSSIDRAGRITESAVTRGYVAFDHAGRLFSDRGTGGLVRRLEQISPSSRTLPQAADRRFRADESAEAGAPAGIGSAGGGGSATVSGRHELEDWAIDRLTRGSGGPIVHVECGDGRLVRCLAEAGYDSVGADPGSGAASRPLSAAGTPGHLARAGALEFLGGVSRSSLGGVLLSGITERLSPGRARALAHLAASRLRPGGVVVVLSAHADGFAGDLISADLSPGRPLHPITWCHLLSRYRLAELTINDPVGLPAGRYAVAARKPPASP